MKNKGLLMIALILAFCGVLSAYALTEGSTEQLEIDAARVNSILYCDNLQEGIGIDIDDPEYVKQIVTAMNQLELRKANFKINRNELAQMSCITFGYYDGVNIETMKIGGIILLPDNQLMVNWGNQSGCYNADYEKLSVLTGEVAQQTIEKDRYASGGFTIAFPEEMLED